MKKIFLYDLDRQLLLFLLMSNLEKDDLTFVALAKQFKKRLDKLPGKKVYLFLFSKNRIFSLIYRFLILKKYRYIFKKQKIEIYGDSDLALGKFCFGDFRINLLEDGTKNYMTNLETIKKQKFYLKERIFYDFKIRKNKFENIEKIYLTTFLCKEIPTHLKNKNVEIINMKELWDKKSLKEKNIIKECFDFNDTILTTLNSNNKISILFTQPLSEDKVLTEDEKIFLYRQIINKYPDETIIIKKHPREKTDYSKYFPELPLIKENYPTELLMLMDIKFYRAITLFSTAVFGFDKDIKIDFYGTEVNDKLLKKFGSCDNLMVRNAYI